MRSTGPSVLNPESTISLTTHIFRFYGGPITPEMANEIFHGGPSTLETPSEMFHGRLMGYF